MTIGIQEDAKETLHLAFSMGAAVKGATFNASLWLRFMKKCFAEAQRPLPGLALGK